MSGAGRPLVHGSYRPQNVLIAGRRTCPVDWELAARGSPFYDLAYLVDGWDGAGLRELLDAYLAAAGEGGAAVPEDKELAAWLAPFGLHKLVASLGHCGAWKDPAATAVKALDR